MISNISQLNELLLSFPAPEKQYYQVAGVKSNGYFVETVDSIPQINQLVSATVVIQEPNNQMTFALKELENLHSIEIGNIVKNSITIISNSLQNIQMFRCQVETFRIQESNLKFLSICWSSIPDIYIEQDIEKLVIKQTLFHSLKIKNPKCLKVLQLEIHTDSQMRHFDFDKYHLLTELSILNNTVEFYLQFGRCNIQNLMVFSTNILQIYGFERLRNIRSLVLQNVIFNRNFKYLKSLLSIRLNLEKDNSFKRDESLSYSTKLKKLNTNINLINDHQNYYSIYEQLNVDFEKYPQFNLTNLQTPSILFSGHDEGNIVLKSGYRINDYPFDYIQQYDGQIQLLELDNVVIMHIFCDQLKNLEILHINDSQIRQKELSFTKLRELQINLSVCNQLNISTCKLLNYVNISDTQITKLTCQEMRFLCTLIIIGTQINEEDVIAYQNIINNYVFKYNQ